MKQNLTDHQKELFYDIYKTVLGATISSTPGFYSGECRKEDVIRDAIKLAKVSVELLTDEKGLRQPADVEKELDDKWDEIKSAL